jgi:hypothetical protein
MPQAPDDVPSEGALIAERLQQDWDWLAAQGVELSQFAVDPSTGQVQVYLVRYSEQARQVLTDRYGPAVTVSEESRTWRFT